MKPSSVILVGILAFGCVVLGTLLVQTQAKLEEIRSTSEADVKAAREQVKESTPTQQAAEATRSEAAKRPRKSRWRRRRPKQTPRR